MAFGAAWILISLLFFTLTLWPYIAEREHRIPDRESARLIRLAIRGSVVVARDQGR